MRKLIEFLGVLAAFFVLGASIAFVEWLAQFEWLGWIVLTGILITPIYLAIKLWRSI